MNSNTTNPEIKEQTTYTNQIHKKASTLHNFPINNDRFVEENPAPIKSETDNQEKSLRQNMSTDRRKGEAVLMLAQ